MTKGNKEALAKAVGKMWVSRNRKPIALILAVLLPFAFQIMLPSMKARRKAQRARTEWMLRKKNFLPLPLCDGTSQRNNSQHQIVTSTQRFKTNIATGDIPPEYFKSQGAEDKVLMGWFSNLCHGTYIEMGGLDGVFFSNSFRNRQN
jgi:hypothetical protein